MNDEFEAAREAIIKERLAAGDSREDAEDEAEQYEWYGPRGVIFVPEEARWAKLAGAVDDVATEYLQPALDALERQKGNSELRGLFAHVNFNRIGGGGSGKGSAAALTDKRLAALIEHFGSIRLRGEDFEFPDMIGAAYEYLIKDFADSAGSKGGEYIRYALSEKVRHSATSGVSTGCFWWTRVGRRFGWLPGGWFWTRRLQWSRAWRGANSSPGIAGPVCDGRRGGSSRGRLAWRCLNLL
ncbi:hypothetical protein AQJ91_08390 [Streptomyces dysideae]|uniref:site-specific DNA-methyltransferase (adenine-specific) n=1 Tax=Streptomyces dysideae TaxID=909626 RepID=A0A124IFJ4_9ACTN|nr:hypothetical protein AQJ91_08390 [Streptomyces dysideae]